MKTSILTTLLISLIIFQACQNQSKKKPGFVEENVKFATEQYSLQTVLIEESGKNPQLFFGSTET